MPFQVHSPISAVEGGMTLRAINRYCTCLFESWGWRTPSAHIGRIETNADVSLRILP